MNAPEGFIEFHPGYRANDNGQVWSDASGRVLSGTACGQMGYRAIQFPDGSRRYIHEIVCTLFHGPRPDGQQVRHLNGNLNDNRAANLAWGTKLENEADRILHGTTAKGERNPQAKLTQAKVAQMREVRRRTGHSYARIAAQFNISTMTAHRAITGGTWK